MPLTQLNFTGTGLSSFPSGSILQTQKTVITTPFYVSLGSDTDTTVTGLTVDITPNFSNSIILLTGQYTGEFSQPHNVVFTFFRDTTKLGQPTRGNRNVGVMTAFNSFDGGNDDATTPDSCFFQHHDTPSTTSQITYKMSARTGATSGTSLFVNRTVNDTDDATNESGMSFIMAQEIKV